MCSLELRSRADRWAARRQSISDHPCDASTSASVGVREESRKIVGVVIDMPGHRCEGQLSERPHSSQRCNRGMEVIRCTLLGYPFVPRYDARRWAALVECRLQDPSGTRSGRIGAIAALRALPIVDVVAVVRILHRPGPLSDLGSHRRQAEPSRHGAPIDSQHFSQEHSQQCSQERFLRFDHHVVRLCAARQLTATLTGTLTATLTDPGHGPVSGRARPGGAPGQPRGGRVGSWESRART